MTTAAEAAALDARTIAGGVHSGDLMRRAAEAVTDVIEARFAEQLSAGVLVACGPGNNGGDGWLVAALLAQRGADVRVLEAAPARSGDARAAREAAAALSAAQSWTGEQLVVDALLGTGASGEPRGEIARAVEQLDRARAGGAVVAAVDMPTGVDATTGHASDSACDAHVTITFGSVKRGQLAARNRCGTIVVADIGLSDTGSELPELVTPALAHALVPPIAFDSHKGSRGGISIVGGGAGMAGAAIMAGQGALRSGAGSSRICVADENATAVHAAVPPALVTTWSRVLADVEKHFSRWPEAIVIGCGLGDDDAGNTLLQHVLDLWSGPLVLDADALNLLAGRTAQMADRLRARSDRIRAVLTPHPAEMKRLLDDGRSGGEVSAARYDVAAELARATGTVVLFKGIPTVISAPDGRSRISATGTPALATGGAGDVLAGIIGTLLAQKLDPFDAASAGAWFHGRAAELATGARTARGITIADVVDRLHDVWLPPTESLPPGVMAELPAIG